MTADKPRRKYRVIVERVFRKEFIVEAGSDSEAEDLAYERAHDDAGQWPEEDMEVRDCTSVQMPDGTWRFVNGLTPEETARRDAQ